MTQQEPGLSGVAPSLRVLPGATGPAPPAPAPDWEAVYRDNAVPVYRFVYARTGNRPDAEDVTAQAFLRALPALRLDAPAPQIRGYLLSAARSALAEHWTRHYATEGTVELGDDVAAPDEQAGHGDASPRGPDVAALLGRLPDNYRRVLELRFLRGCSIRETAAEMRTSSANVKVIQWRALRRAAALDGEEGT